MRQWPGGPVFTICLPTYTSSSAGCWKLSPSGLVLVAAFPPPPPHPNTPPHLPFLRRTPLHLEVPPPLARNYVVAPGDAAAPAAVGKLSRPIASPAVACAASRDDRACCMLPPS